MLILALIASLLPAHASDLPEAPHQGNALSPLIRLHLGVSWSGPGPAPYGIAGGMDSRLTRFLYIDVGGSYDPTRLSGADLAGREALFDLRHDIYVLPGLNIPHRQPSSWSWDLQLRAGLGVMWTAYTGGHLAQNTYAGLDLAPAFVGGVDVGARSGPWGLRLSGRGFAGRPYSAQDRDQVFYWSPQASVELLYQFY